MENHKTPRPGTEKYDVENTESLNTPAFNSSTDRRASHELPAIEHLDEEQAKSKPEEDVPETPKTNLGNGDRDKDEDEREKIINTPS